MNLPAIPSPGVPICIDDVIAIESTVAKQIVSMTDVEELEEMRAKAEALVTYLQGKELHGPMLGAQRRIEARIGQLLGEARNGRPATGENPYHGKDFNERQRVEFRVLSRGWGQLADAEWRQSRAALLKLIHQRFPMPRRTPEVVVTAEGSTRKARSERVKEIAKLAGEGYRALQIAEKLGISDEQVRNIARAGQIALPDAAIGKRLKLDPVRILTETINGVDAYVSGLSLLDETGLPHLPEADSACLMQALVRSINGLKKLRTKMEKAYARHDASAA